MNEHKKNGWINKSNNLSNNLTHRLLYKLTEVCSLLCKPLYKNNYIIINKVKRPGRQHFEVYNFS